MGVGIWDGVCGRRWVCFVGFFILFCWLTSCHLWFLGGLGARVRVHMVGVHAGWGAFFITEVALCTKPNIDPNVYFHVIDPMCTVPPSLSDGTVEPSGQSVVNTELTFSCNSGFH